MQPNDHQNDQRASRARKYDAYDPGRLYGRLNDAPQQPSVAAYAADTPPHDVRSGYVPPQSSPVQPYDPAAYAVPQHTIPAEQMYQQQAVSQGQQYYQEVPQYYDQSGTQQVPYSQASPYETLTSPHPVHHPDHKTYKTSAAKRKTGGLFAPIVQATVQVDRVTRQSVKLMQHTFEPPHLMAMRSKRQRIFMRSFYAVASLSMLSTLYFGVHQVLYGNQKPPQQSVLGAATSANNDALRASEMPSEKMPTTQDMRTYLVASPYPRYMRIPSLNIESRVRRLGIDASGAIGTPNNIFDVGWYDSSVKPGDSEGVSLIVGHLSGPTAHGVFWDINKLTPGAAIAIEKGNGVVVNYRVTHVDTVSKDTFNIADYLTSETPGHNDLRLITSTGKYDNVSVRGSDRYVVFAQQVQ